MLCSHFSCLFARSCSCLMLTIFAGLLTVFLLAYSRFCLLARSHFMCLPARIFLPAHSHFFMPVCSHFPACLLALPLSACSQLYCLSARNSTDCMLAAIACLSTVFLLATRIVIACSLVLLSSSPLTLPKLSKTSSNRPP